MLLNKRSGEYRFYQMYFRRAAMTNDLKLILGHGFREAARAGVGPMDALHLAAAHLLKADEFITTERPNKSVHRSCPPVLARQGRLPIQLTRMRASKYRCEVLRRHRQHAVRKLATSQRQMAVSEVTPAENPLYVGPDN